VRFFRTGQEKYEGVFVFSNRIDGLAESFVGAYALNDRL